MRRYLIWILCGAALGLLVAVLMPSEVVRSFSDSASGPVYPLPDDGADHATEESVEQSWPDGYVPLRLPVSVSSNLVPFLQPGDQISLSVAVIGSDGTALPPVLVGSAILSEEAWRWARTNERSAEYLPRMYGRVTLYVPLEEAQNLRTTAGQSGLVIGLADGVYLDSLDAVAALNTGDDNYPPAGSCFVSRRGAEGVETIVLPCPEAGAATVDPVSRILDQLQSADLAFNRPESMKIGTTTVIELVLSPQEVSALSDLPADAPVEEQADAVGLSQAREGTPRVVQGVDYALRMQAELSGSDFEISPSGPEEKTVLPNRSVRWVWSVEPTEPGPERVLTLSLSALVSQGDTDLPPVQIETFTETINVEISGWDRVVALSQEISAVHTMVAGVGATLFGIVAWLWSRRRKEPKPEPDPLEVIVTHRVDDDQAD